MTPNEEPGPETGWMDLILAEEEALERLVARAPRLAKFRRVLNDERAAALLRVGDVARMLKLDVTELLAVARGEPAPSPAAEPPEDPTNDSWPDAAAERVTLDLRPVFEQGHEPLAMILDAIRDLSAGAALVVHAPFHPLPLRRLLAGRGYRSSACALGPDHWQVSFRQAPT